MDDSAIGIASFGVGMGSSQLSTQHGTVSFPSGMGSPELLKGTGTGSLWHTIREKFLGDKDLMLKLRQQASDVH